jgi:magnesium-transporting ATPase (P-type)
VKSPILLSGSNIITGEGYFIVISIGAKSCVGRIKSLLVSADRMTPLQIKLDQLGKDIGKIGIFSALLIIVILFVRFFTHEIETEHGVDFSHYMHSYLKEWFSFLIIGISIFVVAVPEGLPLAVVISLAYSVRKMLSD